MEISITNTSENKLLKRREIAFAINFGKRTASREEVKAALAKQLGVNPGLLVVQRIDSEYGCPQGKGVAHVYHDEKSMGIVPEHLAKRGTKKGEKKEEAPAPAPAKKEEKKEKKEEKPTEPKAKPLPQKRQDSAQSAEAVLADQHSKEAKEKKEEKK